MRSFLWSMLLLAAAAAQAQAQVTVSGAWARGTVQGQTATGAFMHISSAEGATLIGVDSPVAGIVEIHEMRMEGNTMRMRGVEKLELPAGRTVELKPGGYHVMLMDLKQDLKAGDAVPVTLVVEGAGGKRESIELKAPVKALADSHSKKH
jgi:copper(I)-binding protein